MNVDKKKFYDQLPDELKELADQIDAAITDISNGVNVQGRHAEIRKIRNDLIAMRDKNILNHGLSAVLNKVVNELLLLESEVLVRSGNLPKAEHPE